MKSPMKVVPLIGLGIFAIHGVFWLGSMIPSIDFGSSTSLQSSSDEMHANAYNDEMHANAYTPPTTFELPPLDDSFLSPEASSDDSMTLEENRYLPKFNGGYEDLEFLSNFHKETFPAGSTVSTDGR